MICLNGTVKRDGKFWIVECQSLNAMTQGTTRKEAILMIEDWVKNAVNDPSFQMKTRITGRGEFVLSFPDSKVIIGLILERARISAKLTYDELAKRSGYKSRSTVKTMTKGIHDHSIGKISELLNSIGFDLTVSVRMNQL